MPSLFWHCEERKGGIKMKLVLVISLAIMLGFSMSDSAQAHGYKAAAGGSFYWSNNGYLVGVNYGAPYAVPYYAPPPRYYGRGYRAPRYEYRHGKRHGYHKGYKKGYRKGYRKGKRRGHRDYDHGYYGDH